VDATSEFATVVRYKLGRHRVVMAAEIDAAAAPTGGAGAPGQQQQQQQQEQRPQYVELKCYKIPGHPRAEANIYSQKHPRWCGWGCIGNSRWGRLAGALAFQSGLGSCM
jgi:hypothetical protein